MSVSLYIIRSGLTGWLVTYPRVRVTSMYDIVRACKDVESQMSIGSASVMLCFCIGSCIRAAQKFKESLVSEYSLDVSKRRESIVNWETMHHSCPLSGDNALLIYMLQEAFASRLPYEFFVGYNQIPRVLLSLWTVFLTLFLGFFTRHFDIRLKL